MSRPIYLVDVFAERRYAGNPLAAVAEADGLPQSTMQQIAEETNFSETTFIASAPERDGGYRVRIYTPAREIAFAGHPNLGTAWVIRHRLGQDARVSVQLNLAVGPVSVTFEATAEGVELAWFRAPPVVAGRSCAHERIAAAVGLSAQDLDTTSPVQQFSAGTTSALIVPLRSLEALRRSRLALEAFAPLAREGCPPLVYLFCRETHDRSNQLCARFFFDAHGVREDPATGNGAAFLGAYLLDHRLLASPQLDLRIEQGHEVRRPSVVRLRAKDLGGSREIYVGGRVVLTMEGRLV